MSYWYFDNFGSSITFPNFNLWSYLLHLFGLGQDICTSQGQALNSYGMSASESRIPSLPPLILHNCECTLTFPHTRPFMVTHVTVSFVFLPWWAHVVFSCIVGKHNFHCLQTLPRDKHHKWESNQKLEHKNAKMGVPFNCFFSIKSTGACTWIYSKGTLTIAKCHINLWIHQCA